MERSQRTLVMQAARVCLVNSAAQQRQVAGVSDAFC